MHRTGLLAATVATLLCASPALAQEAPPPPEAPPPVEKSDKDDTLTEDSGRDFFMELNFRGRLLTFPDGLIDIWTWDNEVNGEPAAGPRPSVGAYQAGIEFVVKKKPVEGKGGSPNGIFYLGWTGNMTAAGYWDDRDSGIETHQDGDYVSPTSDLGLVSIGAKYAYEIHIARTSDTNGNFGASMLIGTGLGVGIVVGRVDYWVNATDGTPSYLVAQTGAEPEGDKLEGWPVLPLWDPLELSLRFNFADRVVLRFDVGITAPTINYGATLGMMF